MVLRIFACILMLIRVIDDFNIVSFFELIVKYYFGQNKTFREEIVDILIEKKGRLLFYLVVNITNWLL